MFSANFALPPPQALPGVSMSARAVIVSLATLLAASGCDDAVTGTTQRSLGTSAPSLSAQSRPNLALARYLALSLDRPNVRKGLFEAMRRSPVYEGKLLLDHTLEGGGIATGLLNSMASAGGIPTDSIRALVERAPSLELYLPVEEHRNRWDGGDEVIVATGFDESSAPHGFDVNGESVPLSADTPPMEPTISLVEAESFRADGSPKPRSIRRPKVRSACGETALQQCGGGGTTYGVCEPPPAGPDTRGIGIRERTFCLRHLDSHEPWHKGKPEFFILLAGTEDVDSFAEVHPRRDIPTRVWDDVGAGDWTEAGVNLFDLDTDMGNRNAIQCFEEDSGDSDSFRVSGTTDFSIGPVSFSFDFDNIDLTGDEDDNCGSYELLLRTSTGEFTGFRQAKSLPDGTNELEWLSYGFDLTS